MSHSTDSSPSSTSRHTLISIRFKPEAYRQEEEDREQQCRLGLELGLLTSHRIKRLSGSRWNKRVFTVEWVVGKSIKSVWGLKKTISFV